MRNALDLWNSREFRTTIVLVANEAYGFLAKTPFLSLWSPSCSAPTQLRARGQFPYHASSPGGGIARRCAQGAAATRAQDISQTRPGGVGQARSHDQTRHPLRHHK